MVALFFGKILFSVLHFVREWTEKKVTVVRQISWQLLLLLLNISASAGELLYEFSLSKCALSFIFKRTIYCRLDAVCVCVTWIQWNFRAINCNPRNIISPSSCIIHRSLSCSFRRSVAVHCCCQRWKVNLWTTWKRKFHCNAAGILVNA